MAWLKLRSALISIVTVCLVVGVAVVLILYGRGYRFDFLKKSLKSTGLLVVSSDPSAAQVLIDNKLSSATPQTLTLNPGYYDVTLAKEGFQSWEKRVRVQGEVVTKIEATLIPVNPSLTALTATGVSAPVLSPDGAKLAFIIPKPPEATSSAVLVRPGVWILDLADKPLGLNRDARQVSNTGLVDYTKATLSWSPDSKQVLLCQKTTINNCWLLDAGIVNDPLKPVSNLTSLLADWQTQAKVRETEKLASFPKEFLAIATSSARLLTFSPDETKVLYEATAAATISTIINPPLIGTDSTPETRDLKPGNLYIYDLKEDRNYGLGELKSLPYPSWLPASKNLLIVTTDKIQIMEFDGSNRRTLYSGPFMGGFAAPWTNGSKIVILTNLNTGTSAVNNLYTVNLK